MNKLPKSQEDILIKVSNNPHEGFCGDNVDVQRLLADKYMELSYVGEENNFYKITLKAKEYLADREAYFYAGIVEDT